MSHPRYQIDYLDTCLDRLWHTRRDKAFGSGHHQKKQASKLFPMHIITRETTVKHWIHFSELIKQKWLFVLWKFDPLGSIELLKSWISISVNYLILVCGEPAGSQPALLEEICKAHPQWAQKCRSLKTFFSVCAQWATYVGMTGTPSWNTVSGFVNLPKTCSLFLVCLSVVCPTAHVY